MQAAARAGPARAYSGKRWTWCLTDFAGASLDGVATSLADEGVTIAAALPGAPLIAALADPADPRGPEQVSYALSKRAVLRLCERRTAAWAEKGARINSISPGTIWTPMGRREAAEDPGAARVVEVTPAGRWGTAMDIAAAARFLAGDEAASSQAPPCA